ncbi:MAG: DUF998 domain-containing protein [Promethearchaeota archaeon]
MTVTEEYIENSPITLNEFFSYSTVQKKIRLHYPPKILRILLLTGLAVYLCMLIGSVSISKLFGYKIISHTISQLGAMAISPIPFMFDSACMIGGLTSILFFYILSRKIQFTYNSLIINKVSLVAKWIGIMGSIGTLALGIFSLDRSGPHGIYHVISSLCAFGGYILALSVFGAILIRSKSKLLKIISIKAMFPCLILIIGLIFPCPLLEWMLLLSILELLILFFSWVCFN